MHFGYPWMLALLAIPVVLAWWEWRRRGLEVRLPFDHGQLTPHNRLRAIVKSASLLPMVLLAVAIVLLARPQRASLGETVQETRNIQLLLDISGSMESPYGNGTRYEGAMQALRQFVHTRRGDAFALTAFAVNVYPWVPLTKDPSAIELAQPFLDPNRWPAIETTGTMIGAALEDVRQQLTNAPGDRVIILVTDGQSNDLDTQRTSAIANKLANDHITVYSVFIGDNESTVDIGRIAELTGGSLFRPDNPAALAEAFRHIDHMQPTRHKPFTLSYVDSTFSAVLAGIVALAAQLLASFGLRFTPW